MFLLLMYRIKHSHFVKQKERVYTRCGLSSGAPGSKCTEIVTWPPPIWYHFKMMC